MTQNGRINDFDYEPGGCGTQALVYGIIIAIIFLFSSCKSIQYVPVETVIHDSIQVERVEFVKDTTNESTVVKDSSWMSIHIADSVELANIGIQLDGVTKAFIIEKNKVRELESKLSSAKEKVVTKDSIVYKDKEVQVPYPVEKALSPYQQFKQDYGGWAFLIVLLAFIYVILIFVRKFLPRWQ
jgi:hypothetical protein